MRSRRSDAIHDRWVRIEQLWRAERDSVWELSNDRLRQASGRLAPLPTAASQLTAIVSSDDVDMREVVDIITYDPVLTAVVLQQANSVHASFTRATSTVSEAVLRLGLSAVAAIAMRTAVAATLNRPLPMYGMDAGDLFAHSAKSAVAAEVLRTASPGRVPPTAPTVALLHDVGKILISDVVGERATELVRRLSDLTDVGLTVAEAEVFGMHHGQAAVHAIREWKLPLSFIEAIVNHHAGPGKRTPLALAVSVADAMAHAIDDELPGPATEHLLCDEMLHNFNTLGIGDHNVLGLLASARERHRAIQAVVAVA